MTDRPIIFSGPMVRAILDGSKNMTRRILKLPTKGQYVRKDMGGWEPTTVGGGSAFTIARDGTRTPAPEMVAIWNQTTGYCLATPYQVGDRLWVRENFKIGLSDTHDCYGYQADMMYGCGKPIPKGPHRWRPSIHMPRNVSRLTLEVVAVKVEHLQDISEEDAIAEGIFYQQPNAEDLVWYKNWCEENGWDSSVPMDGVWTPGIEKIWGPTARFAFRQLWQSLNAKRAPWESNPWVVAVSFKTLHGNIDSLKSEAA